MELNAILTNNESYRKCTIHGINNDTRLNNNYRADGTPAICDPNSYQT